MNQDVIFLLISLIGFAIIFALVWYFTRAPASAGSKDSKAKKEPKKKKKDAEDGKTRGGVAALRKRKGRRRDQEEDAEEVAQAVQEEQKKAASGEESDEDSENGEPRNLTRKDALKAQRRQEREEMRQFMQAQREEKEKRTSARDETYRKKQEEREAKERAAEEEAERLRVAEEAKQAAEFEEWKGMITVDEEGTAAEEDPEEAEGRLQQFIEFIKDKKVVVLEELAAEFNMNSQDVVNRVRSLMEANRLTGVIDDRGKFVYITKEELESVANFINRRGRVTLRELAQESNRLINLESKPLPRTQSIGHEADKENEDDFEIITEERGRGK